MTYYTLPDPDWIAAYNARAAARNRPGSMNIEPTAEFWFAAETVREHYRLPATGDGYEALGKHMPEIREFHAWILNQAGPAAAAGN